MEETSSSSKIPRRVTLWEALVTVASDRYEEMLKNEAMQETIQAIAESLVELKYSTPLTDALGHATISTPVMDKADLVANKPQQDILEESKSVIQGRIDQPLTHVSTKTPIAEAAVGQVEQVSSVPDIQRQRIPVPKRKQEEFVQQLPKPVLQGTLDQPTVPTHISTKTPRPQAVVDQADQVSYVQLQNIQRQRVSVLKRRSSTSVNGELSDSSSRGSTDRSGSSSIPAVRNGTAVPDSISTISGTARLKQIDEQEPNTAPQAGPSSSSVNGMPNGISPSSSRYYGRSSATQLTDIPAKAPLAEQQYPKPVLRGTLDQPIEEATWSQVDQDIQRQRPSVLKRHSSTNVNGGLFSAIPSPQRLTKRPRSPSSPEVRNSTAIPDSTSTVLQPGPSRSRLNGTSNRVAPRDSCIYGRAPTVPQADPSSSRVNGTSNGVAPRASRLYGSTPADHSEVPAVPNGEATASKRVQYKVEHPNSFSIEAISDETPMTNNGNTTRHSPRVENPAPWQQVTREEIVITAPQFDQGAVHVVKEEMQQNPAALRDMTNGEQPSVYRKTYVNTATWMMQTFQMGNRSLYWQLVENEENGHDQFDQMTNGRDDSETHKAPVKEDGGVLEHSFENQRPKKLRIR